MHSTQITAIIRQSAGLLGQDVDGAPLLALESLNRTYEDSEVEEFKRDLMEEANRQNIIYLDNSLSPQRFKEFLTEVHIPIVAFEKKEQGWSPVIFYRKKNSLRVIHFTNDEAYDIEMGINEIPQLHLNIENKVDFMGVFSYKSLVSEDPDQEDAQKKLTPIQRLIRLLSEEKKDIFYIYVYAILIGLISLTLPLGIQATVSLISGGVFFSSVYVLIAFVIAGVLAAGGLQVMQITLVEYLQRRVFTKAAFEFAFRVPRMKVEALQQYYAPELMNRFFDVLTIQKGLPKLLIDLSSGVIQILFGLVLLSFYHPFFVLFGIILLSSLTVIFYLTGPQGLRSSILESKYKYKVVYWLEEVARTINSFKLSGNTNLPLKKTDFNVNNYLKNRKAHFNVLIGQYTYVLIFKALVTGGLLIIGTVLVVQREITLGQFVASEVIIILTLSSVEKIIMYMDVVYDMLTAVDKIANVTDLPLERTGGLDLKAKHQHGFTVQAKGLSYKFPGDDNYILRNIDLNILSGESVCISGVGGSGKTILINTLSGLHTNYEGVVTIDGYSLRDLDLSNLRDKIGKNVSQEDIFEGTILENILVGKPHADPDVAIDAINMLEIGDELNAMPDGLSTQMVSGGKGLSTTLVNKIILARCLAKKPRMLILNDYFTGFSRNEKNRLISLLTQDDHQWTLLVVSNDPVIMEACDRLILMDRGTIRNQGSFEELKKLGELKNIII